jgi:hypothetical protein
MPTAGETSLSRGRPDDCRATRMSTLERFVIRRDERRQRWIHVGWGLLFSTGMIAVVALDYQQDPQPSARGLLWSVIIVLLMANVGNLFFLLRYLRKIRDHHLELEPGRLRFVTAGESSELDLAQVAAIRLFRRWGKLQHIQLVLRNNRGIRLEGYQDLDRLAVCLQAELPSGTVLR